LGDDGDGLLLNLIVGKDYLLKPNCPVRFLRLVNDFLKPVMRHDVESVQGRHASSLAVGESKATSDRLLDEGARIGGAQRHDRIEVSDVPAFLEHVDVDNDFGQFVRVLDFEQAFDSLLFLHAGIDLEEDLVLVAGFKKAIGFDELHQLCSMCRVAGNDCLDRCSSSRPPFPRVIGVASLKVAEVTVPLASDRSIPARWM
jgi:hypothetical protein